MNRRMLCLLLLAAPLAAQTPSRPIAPADFAWQWPLDTGAADGAVRVTLTAEVYARLGRFDLGDLAAFNADGESIPFGPAQLAFERLQVPPPPEPVDVPLFRVPADAVGDGAERIALHIARGDDGRLTRLDAEVAPAATATAQELLLDLSRIDTPVTALTLELEDLPPQGLNARVEVAGSDDLARWQPLASNLALVSLQENGLALERRRLELPNSEHPYLRLRRSDGGALPVRAVRAWPTRRAGESSVVALPPLQQLAPEVLPGALDGVFEYRVAGPYPLERAMVSLADTNAVAGYVLESRAADGGPWLERARGTAFRIGGDADAISSDAVALATTRDRHWRLRTTPAQARAPTLALTWRPEQFVLLTQGRAPYRLAAGSRNALRPDYPLRSVLSQLRAQRGDLWLPPEATLGAGSALSGEAALRAPPPPPPYKQWLLWGVLVGGALLVVVLVLKLMRTPVADGDADRG